MNAIKYSLGVVTAIAAVLGMGLISCSDKPTEPAETRPSYKIAFVSERDGSCGVFTMNNNGSDQKRLTFDDAVGPFISWSPDGSKIAFTSRQSPHDNLYEIYVVHADGSFPTRLTYSTHFMGEIEAAPIWSLDGSKIAFRSYRDGNSDVFVMNSDGASLTNVTHDATYNYDPVWRPDGMGVTFASASGNGDSREYRVYFSNTDGSVRELEPVWGGTLGDSLCALFWFPVGSTFGCVHVTPSGSMALDVCTSTPGLTDCREGYFGGSHTADHVTSPVWSPDGSQLAFTSNVEGKNNIYSMNTLDISEMTPKRLTNSLTGEGAVASAWSPDGTEIVFTADWTGNVEIYVMNADGTDVRGLTTSSGSGSPACARNE